MKIFITTMLLVSFYVSAVAAEGDLGIKLAEKANLSLQVAAADDVLDDAEYEDLQAQYQHIIEKFPEWSEGYSGMATLAVMKNQCDDVIHYANIANSKQHNEMAYYSLTLCYTKTARYEEAVNAANTAIALNEALTKNSEFMIYSAFAFTEVGKYDVARGLLGMIMKEEPEIKSNKKFLLAGRNLATRMREAGLIE